MHPLYSIPNFITSALVLALGAFVVLKRPNEKINWLFGLLTWSVAHWLFGYALLYCTAKGPDTALKLARFAYIGVVFIPTFFLHFLDEFLQLRRRAMVVVGYAISFAFLYIIRQDYFMNGTYLYFWGYYPKAGPIYWTWLVYFYAAFGICDYEFTKGYFAGRRSDANSLRTKQLKYVLWANCAASISLMDYLPKFGLQVYPCAYLAAMGWLLLMAYAIVKFRLMDIQLVVRKTLIYSFVSAVLTAVYFLIVSLFASVSSGLIGRASFISIGAAGMVVTIIFLPLFRKVQALIDRLFSRLRIDRETRLMEFSSEIIRQENTENLTQSLGRALEEALHPKSVGLYLQTGRKGAFEEIYGRAPLAWPKSLDGSNEWRDYFSRHPQPVIVDAPDVQANGSFESLSREMKRWNIHAAVPLISRRDVFGFLLLGEKASEEAYTNEDLILLRIIVNQATIAYERPKLLREVSSGFVHEVKMPLSKISLPAELTYMEIDQALSEGTVPVDLLPKIQRRMKYIMDQAFLASHRVDALQQLGAPEIRRKENIDLRVMVVRCAELLKETMALAQTTLRHDMPVDLPVLVGDSQQLEIVFVNLLKNAAEAMEALPAGKPREIRIAGRQENQHVIVEIRDTGPGIQLDDRERVFQAHYTTKGANGAGMGLFLCHQIIEAHGGTIAVIPDSGIGTTFQIVLPKG